MAGRQIAKGVPFRAHAAAGQHHRAYLPSYLRSEFYGALMQGCVSKHCVVYLAYLLHGCARVTEKTFRLGSAHPCGCLLRVGASFVREGAVVLN